ncbi:TNF receptor-associated factor 6-B, partial [Tetrabaena socialis]
MAPSTPPPLGLSDFDSPEYDAQKERQNAHAPPEQQMEQVVRGALDEVMRQFSLAVQEHRAHTRAVTDAVDSCLASCLEAIEMQYPAREDNPVSAISLEHGSWEQEQPPDPCTLDSWLRSALPETVPTATSGSGRDSWFRTQKRKDVPCTCPYCRQPLRYSQLRADPALIARLDALPVLCPFHAHGCTGTHPRARLPAHLGKECAHAPVRCPDCGASLPRGQLPLHAGSPACPRRRLPCPHAALGCPQLLRRCEVRAHAAAGCAFQPLQCRRCAAVVLRGAAEEHAALGCPAACPCPHRAYGCAAVAPDLARLAEHVGGSCRYAPGAAHVGRLRAALGPADFVYGTAPCGGGGGGGGGGDPQQAPGAGGATAGASYGGRFGSGTLPPCGSYDTEPAGGGSWVHGLWVPASLYPRGLPQPAPPLPRSAAEAEAEAAAAVKGAPWPWVQHSTREAADAAAAAVAADERRPLPRFCPLAPTAGEGWAVPGASAVAAVAAPPPRHGTAVPEQYGRLLRVIRGEEGPCNGNGSGGDGAGGGGSGPSQELWRLGPGVPWAGCEGGGGLVCREAAPEGPPPARVVGGGAAVGRPEAAAAAVVAAAGDAAATPLAGAGGGGRVLGTAEEPAAAQAARGAGEDSAMAEADGGGSGGGGAGGGGAGGGGGDCDLFEALEPLALDPFWWRRQQPPAAGDAGAAGGAGAAPVGALDPRLDTEVSSRVGLRQQPDGGRGRWRVPW